MQYCCSLIHGLRLNDTVRFEKLCKERELRVGGRKDEVVIGNNSNSGLASTMGTFIMIYGFAISLLVSSGSMNIAPRMTTVSNKAAM